MSQAAIAPQDSEPERDRSHRLRDAGDHLTEEKPPVANMPAARPAECYCRVCHKRVTVGGTGAEYGHALDCEHSCYGDGPDGV